MSTKSVKLVAGILLLFSSWGYSQRIVIKGRVIDKNHLGIPFAAVQNINTGSGINADMKGFYILKTTLPATVTSFALGYLSQQQLVQTATTDTIEMNFELASDASQLQTVTITVPQTTRLLIESPNLMDFEVRNNKLWLVYSVKGGDKIEVQDTNGHTLAYTTFKYHFYRDSLAQSPSGYLYSIYKDSAYIYSLDSNSIKIKTMRLDTFNMYSVGVVAYRFPYYYYVNYDALNTRVNFSYYNKPKNIQKTFYRYSDSKLAHDNRESQEVLLAMEGFMALETAANNKVSTNSRKDSLVETVGYIPDATALKELMLRIFQPQGASLFEVEDAMDRAQGLVWYTGDDAFKSENEKERLNRLNVTPSAILRTMDDSVYIFNFNNHTVSIYGPHNDSVREVTLSTDIPYLRYREKDIIVDKEKHACYFKYVRWFHTYLQKIDLVTGTVYGNIELKYPNVYKVRIANGFAYFSYFNTQDHSNLYNGQTCLYRQRLD